MAKKNGASGAKPPTKTEIYKSIAEDTGLARKDVAAVFDSLNGIIKKNLGTRGPGQIALPGLCKIVTQKVPARKAGTRPNPFKPGEMMTVAARPAFKRVKVRPLKGLKEMV